MNEPFYVVQTRLDAEERPDAFRAWFAERTKEAKAEGARWGRYSHYPHDHRLILLEAWKECPGSEGEPRFALAAD